MRFILSKGYTYIEVIIVMGIFTILVTLATISFPGVANKVSVDAAVQTVISDIKSQQLKAMTGADNSDGLSQPFGVHFTTNNYSLFRNNSSDPSSFTIQLQATVQFSSIDLPSGGDIIFAVKSGEISNYDSAHNRIIIRNTESSAQKTIQFNKMGVVTSIN